MTSTRLNITNHCVDPDKRQLLINWSDGRQDVFPYLWLRHSHNFPLMGRAGQLAETQGRDDISHWDQDAGALTQN